jgi:hypothetical protein
VSQESPEPRSQQTRQLQQVRPVSLLFGKRLLTLVSVSLVFVLVLALRPSLLKAAWDGVARILHGESMPPPISPGNNAKHEMQSPAPVLPQTPSAETEAQALQLWTEFEKSAWDASLQEWSNLHPDIPCAPFHGNMWGGGADKQWSQQCSTGREREAVHWPFYVFGLQEPFVPRLEQFDVTTCVLPEKTLVSLQQSLQTRVVTRFSRADDQRPKMARVRPASWPQSMRWLAPDVEIELNLSEFDPQRREGRLRLQGRHRALLDALNEDERLKLVGSSDYLYEYYKTDSGMDALLADNLRTDFPDVVTMLMKDQPEPDPQTREANQQKIRQAIQEQLHSQIKAAGQSGPRAAIIAVPQTNTNWKAEEFHDALVRLLTSAKAAPGDRQPILLLAADRLARRLPSVMANDNSHDADWDDR